MEEGRQPIRASTVILARQHDGDVQVYLLKRSERSSFMPGNYVFPGGTVDPEDWDSGLWKSHVDLDLEEISCRLGGGLTEEEALAHGAAAIRETFEEAGVLLASQTEKSQENLHHGLVDRIANHRRRGWFRDWVVDQELTLTLSRLARWAHWITPTIRKQRYDTRFFLASMPQGQECLPDATETTHGIWIGAEEALLGNLRGEIPLSPPTLVTLHELLPYSDLERLEKHAETRPWGERRLPRLIRLPKGALILLPWDPQYDQEVETHTSELDPVSLPPGEPSSRLVIHDGIWMPVRPPGRPPGGTI